MHLLYTLPDFAYAVSLANQSMHKPKKVHLQAVYTMLHYLKWERKSCLKEAVATHSSAESAFRAMTQETCEFPWLR